MQNGHLRILLSIFVLATIPIYALVILGSFSLAPGIPNIWLAEVTAPSIPGILIHAGYFGMCLVKNHLTTCGNSASVNSHDLARELNAPEAEAVINVVLISQRKIILYFIVVGGFLFTIGACAVAAHHYSSRTSTRESPRRTMVLYRASMVPFCAALAFTIASGLTTTQIINALHWVTQFESGAVEFHTGRVMQALQWLLVGMVTMVCLGTWLLHSRDDHGRSAYTSEKGSIGHSQGGRGGRRNDFHYASRSDRPLSFL